MAKLKAHTEYLHIPVREHSIPLQVIYENRRSARVSLAKKHAILRLPILLSLGQKERHVDWARKWVLKKMEEDRNLLGRYIPRDYQSGQWIQLRGREFVLEVLADQARKTALGKLDGNRVIIHLPAGLDAMQKHKLCSTIISRIMAGVFLPEIKTRVHEINERYFQQEISRVRIKYNVSNWGSCSSNRIINLSSRLLLTPQLITDYIIIHELAHLVEMNHSPAFWAVVERVMPDYDKAEKWLSRYGEQCNW